MLELEADVQRELDRYVAQIEASPARFGKPYMSIDEVLRAHFMIANHFYLEGEGIGGIGPKDTNALESTVFRQVSGFGGRPRWNDIFDIASTLFYGIIKNHCFHDANKRTAFLTLLYQLYMADFCPSVPEKVIEDFTVEIAENALVKYARYKELVKKGHPDPEVTFISYWIKKRVRRLDHKRYIITYRELSRILNRYGFYLEDPHHNTIDVVRYEKIKPMFWGKEREVKHRVGNIGFPRWTAQVQPDTMKYVRQLTKLTAKDGVDSGAFFDNFDPLQSLITTYNAPLMSLAHR